MRILVTKMFTQTGWQRLAALLVVGVIGLPLSCTAGFAQESNTDTNNDAVRRELQSIQSSIILSRERAEVMRTEIGEMDGDRARQNAALIAAAQRVKLAEIEVASIEERLAQLITSEIEIRKRLDGADKDVSNILASLQRISKSPPPALIVDPGDALGSARGAMLLATILPQLRNKAGNMGTDLQSLLDVRQTAQGEEETLRINLAVLFEEQLRIATLIEARKRGVVRVNTQLQAEEKQAEELAARANSLGELIDNLSKNIDSVSAAARAASAAVDSSWVNLDEQTILLAFADTKRKQPAVPFAAARGFLATPASGVIINQFGADDGFGGITKGISIVTRADAQVVAPADGWVMYKGPYLNYGQIIILNPGQGYSILLAGLETSSIELGQFVMMGEPVGAMGSRTVGQAVTTSAGVSRPTLYIELREQDTPLNPSNWWASKDNQTQNG